MGLAGATGTHPHAQWRMFRGRKHTRSARIDYLKCLGPRSRRAAVTSRRACPHGRQLCARDTATLARHPSQQAAHHLPCGRPPDFFGPPATRHRCWQRGLFGQGTADWPEACPPQLSPRHRAQSAAQDLGGGLFLQSQDRVHVPQLRQGLQGQHSSVDSFFLASEPPPTTRFQVPARPGPRRQIQRRRT